MHLTHYSRRRFWHATLKLA